MRNRKWLSIFTIVASSAFIPAYANDHFADGYGDNQEEAQRQALAALYASMLVEIRSVSASLTTNDGTSIAQREIRAISNLPLLGTHSEILPASAGQFHVRAVLQSATALPLYKTQLQASADQLKKLMAQLDQHKNAANDYQVLSEMLKESEQYTKYATVARLLGAGQLPAAPITHTSIEQQLHQAEAMASSMDLLIELVTRNIPKNSVYVYPATPRQSHEVTAFGRVLRDNISARISSASTPGSAKYIMRGNYEVLPDRMRLTYRMTDVAGNTTAVRSLAVAPDVYKNLPYKASTTSFDKLLHDGIVVSDDFRVNVATNRGSEDLLFVDGDELELLVKLNHAGYFYVVSHVAHNKDSESYLLELSDDNGPRRFVRYVGADDVNRWVSLGKFSAGAPFGVESLQVIASNVDLIEKLPPYSYDKEADIYRLNTSSAQDGVLRTRGLRPKRDTKKKVESAESVLMMTIMAKNETKL